MAFMRSTMVGLGITFVAVGSIVTGAGQAQPQTPAAPEVPPTTQPAPPRLPGSPIQTRNTSVTPALEGWFRNADGTATIIIGYYNRNQNDTLDISIGPNNRIEGFGTNVDQGQPTHFLPRRQYGMFSITVPKDFGEKKGSWTIVSNGQTNRITLWVNPPYNVSPFISEFNGNTPPVVRLDPAGPEFKGPPRGIAKTFDTVAGAPLPLVVYVKDAGPTIGRGTRGSEPPGAQPPATTPATTTEPSTIPASGTEPGAGAAPAGRGGRGGRGSLPSPRMTWQKYRGVGNVTFANATPPIAAGDGKAETTATFDTPGEFWLRAVFNDTSGDGGGGDQCCWSSLLFKVNVKGK